MQRRQLTGIFKLLSITGGILLLVPMIQSTGIFKSTPQMIAGIVIDVSQIQPGQYQTIEYAGREIWIYHWTSQDRQRHRIDDGRLAWSVMIPYEPHRGCRVHLQEDMTIAARFVEPCFNASFDASGQRLAETGIAAQRNLPAVPFQWQNDHEMRLVPGQR